MSSNSRLVVGFATTGRAEVLCRTVALLEEQTRKPDRVIISAISPADTEGLPDTSFPTDVFHEGAGLCRQRNIILDQLDGDEILVFFDDDFLPAADYLEATEAAFQAQPALAVTTGVVLRDGIGGPGIAFDDGVRILQAEAGTARQADHTVFNGYGCNFAVRISAVLKAEARFDEELPLYCWLEDVDFSRQLAGQGDILRIGATEGVHLGVKSGRTSGTRLGYSQMVNPIYLRRKGTCSTGLAARLMTQNLVSNILKSLRPEPYIDRAGRLKGNMIGIFDLLRFKARPSKALEL